MLAAVSASDEQTGFYALLQALLKQEDARTAAWSGDLRDFTEQAQSGPLRHLLTVS